MERSTASAKGAWVVEAGTAGTSRATVLTIAAMDAEDGGPDLISAMTRRVTSSTSSESDALVGRATEAAALSN